MHSSTRGLRRLIAACALTLASAPTLHAAVDWTRSAGPELPNVLQFVDHGAGVGFMVTDGGLFRTGNGGSNWTLVDTPFLPTSNTPVQRSLYSDGTRLYLSFAMAGNGSRGLYVSTDQGQTWTVFNGSGATGNGGRAHTPVADANHVYIIGEQQNVGQAVQRAAHGTPAWTDITPTSVTNRFGMSELALVGNALCMVYEQTVLRSVDQGANWTQASGIPTNQFQLRFAVNPARSVVYLMSNNKLMRSDDHCATFTELPQASFNSGVYSSPFGVGADNALYISNRLNGTLLRSTDQGASFSTDSTGDLATRFTPLATIGAIGNTTLAGGSGVGAFRRGASAWQAANSGARASSVRQLVAAGTTVHAAVASGTYVSGDAGDTWSERRGGMPALFPSALLRVGNDLYIGGGAITGVPGVHKSSDGGANWVGAGNGLPTFGGVIGLASAGGAIYAAFNSSFVGQADSGVYRSSDGGASWQRASGGINDGGIELLKLAASGTTLFVSLGDVNSQDGINYEGVWRSTDGGANWALVGEIGGAAGERVVGHVYALPSGIYVSRPSTRNSVLFWSRDNGDSWTYRSVTAATYLSEDANGTLYAEAALPGEIDLAFMPRGANDWTRAITGLPQTWEQDPLGGKPLVVGNRLLLASDTAGVWTSALADPPTEDRVPDAFTLVDKLNMAEGQLSAVSDPVTITGLGAPAPVTVSGGGGAAFSIGCNGTFTSATDRTITNGQTICVRHNNSITPGRVTNTALIIGGIADTFSSSIGTGDDTTPSPFTFTDRTEVEAGAVIVSNTIQVSGTNANAPIAVTNGQYSIGCNGTFTNQAGTIAPNGQVCVRHTAASTPETVTNTTLTIGGVSDTFSTTTAAAPVDTTPEPFAFTDVSGVAPGSVVTSNSVTIGGITAPAPISVEGGEYSVGCGTSFTAGAGTIADGQSVCVRHLAAASASTVTSTTLTIGGVADTFTSTTAAGGGSDTTPEAFSFAPRSGVAPGSVVESAAITVAGIDTPAPISVSGGEYRIGSGAYTAQAGTVANGATVQLRLTAGAGGQSRSATLTIGGVSGSFTATSTGDTETIGSGPGAGSSVSTSLGTLVNLTNTATRPAGASGGALEGYSYPFGFYSFEITGLAEGASVSVTLTLPAGAQPDAYVKCNASGNGCAVFPNATFAGNRVTLTLVDGGAGDADGLVNGRISDPGAPAIAPASSAELSASGGGAMGLGWLLATVLLAAGRRRTARR